MPLNRGKSSAKPTDEDRDKYGSSRKPSSQAKGSTSHMSERERFLQEQAPPTYSESSSRPLFSSRDKPSSSRVITAVPTMLHRDKTVQPTMLSRDMSVAPTNLQRDFKTIPPAGTKSLLTSTRDREMASRQTMYDKLTKVEKKEQEEWTQDYIQRTGKCPQNFAWTRIGKGYRCEGGSHYVSDALIEEGKGGIIFLPLDLDGKWGVHWGPYYSDPSDPNRWVYGGPLKNGRHPPEQPLYVGFSMPTFEPGQSPALEKVLAERRRRGSEAEQEQMRRAKEWLGSIGGGRQPGGSSGLPGSRRW